MKKHCLLFLVVCITFSFLHSFSQNVIADSSFEAGKTTASWQAFSSNFGTPICNSGCDGTIYSRTGNYWVWFGGNDNGIEKGSMLQNISLPPGSKAELKFWLEILMINPDGNGADSFIVYMDNQKLFFKTDAHAPNYPNYIPESVDISAYADGGSHSLKFYSTQTGAATKISNFMLDDISIRAEGITGLYENFISEGISVYPNPAGSFITVEQSGGIKDLAICNLMGERLMQFVNLNSDKIIVNTQFLSTGIYTLLIEKEDGSGVNSRFVKTTY